MAVHARRERALFSSRVRDGDSAADYFEAGLEMIRRFLVEVAQHSAKMPPDVSDQAGELYERCADRWHTTTMDELRTARMAPGRRGWVSATLAEQAVSRLLERQGHPHGGETC